MSHNHMCCVILSELYFGAGSLDGVKAMTNVLSLEEEFYLAWEILIFHLGDKEHIASL